MKITESKLNVRLLRRIKRHILEEPRRFFMEGIVATGEPGKQFPFSATYRDLAASVPSCGTAACIHGWTALLSGKTPEQARKLSFAWSERKLGLPRWFGDERLFFSSGWPRRFAALYRKAETPATRAKIAAARIEHLISKGE